MTLARAGFGFNSKPNARALKEKGFDRWEPTEDKAQKLINTLENAKERMTVYKHNERARKLKGGIEVRGKTLRDVKTSSMRRKRKAKRKAN